MSNDVINLLVWQNTCNTECYCTFRWHTNSEVQNPTNNYCVFTAIIIILRQQPMDPEKRNIIFVFLSGQVFHCCPTQSGRAVVLRFKLLRKAFLQGTCTAYIIVHNVCACEGFNVSHIFTLYIYTILFLRFLKFTINLKKYYDCISHTWDSVHHYLQHLKFNFK